jgi:hypothetical protein
VETGCDATGAGSELPADQPDAHMDAGDSHASAATPAHSESLESSTSAVQSSCEARATLCDTAEYAVLGRDTPLNKLRTWVGGLEHIGDAEQVVALLVQSEVSLVNLKLLTVDELAATGVGEAVACELLSQLSSLEQSPRVDRSGLSEQAHGMPFGLARLAPEEEVSQTSKFPIIQLTAIMDADDQMSPSPFSLDEEALLRECVLQKGRTNFADGQILTMAPFLDADYQMYPSPGSLDEEVLLRECLQACPRHMPGAPNDEVLYDGSNVAFLQYPMRCTNFGIAFIDGSAKSVPSIPQSARQGRIEADAELQRSDARAACLPVKREVVLDRPRRRGGHTQKEKMSRETSRLLREWFAAALASNDHARGYPSAAIKQHLAGKSGASKTQIQNWLQNARRRLRKAQDHSLPLTRPLALRAKRGLSLFPPVMPESCVCEPASVVSGAFSMAAQT